MFLVQDTLTDADKALVVLQKSRPSPEQDTDVPSPELGDESLRHAKVIIVDEFNHATTWWIDVLRFVYARPIYIYRSRYQYDCTVVFDYRLIQELKVAEQLETTIKGLGLNYLMATDDRFQKLGTLAAVNQSSVCIVCGHQSDKIKSRLRQQKYEETGIYMVAVPTPEISRIKAAELVGRTYSNYSDVRLWADILIRLRLGTI